MKPSCLLTLILVLHSGAGISAHARDMNQQSLSERDPAWNRLRESADVSALDKLIADDFVLIHSDGQIQHKGDYLAQLATRSRVNQAIVNDEVTVRTYGSTGVVNGISVQSGVSDGKPWSGRFRFTRTWTWRGDDWLLVSSHSSRIADAP